MLQVLEETGFDISKLINKNEYIEAIIHDQIVRLYIIGYIPRETKFQPRTRNEIKACEWFPLADLPANKKDMTPKLKMGVSPNAFFMVLPFVKRMRRWVAERNSKIFTNTRRTRHKSMGDIESTSTAKPKAKAISQGLQNEIQEYQQMNFSSAPQPYIKNSGGGHGSGNVYANVSGNVHGNNQMMHGNMGPGNINVHAHSHGNMGPGNSNVHAHSHGNMGPGNINVHAQSYGNVNVHPNSHGNVNVHANSQGNSHSNSTSHSNSHGNSQGSGAKNTPNPNGSRKDRKIAKRQLFTPQNTQPNPNTSFSPVHKEASPKKESPDEDDFFNFVAPSWANFKFDRHAILDCLT